MNNSETLGMRSVFPVPMSELNANATTPSTLIAFQIGFEGQGDLRCKWKKRVQFPAGGIAAALAAIATENPGPGAGWEPARLRRGNGARLKGLSIAAGKHKNAQGAIVADDRHFYAVFVIQRSDRNVEFLSGNPPFTAASQHAASFLFAPRALELTDDDQIIGINGPDTREVEMVTARRIAHFIVDFRQLVDGDWVTAGFNINLQVSGTDQGVDYVTPVIIDPDMRHPPENGGIPTHP